MFKLLTPSILILSSIVFAMPAIKPRHEILAKKSGRVVLRRTTECSPEGGCLETIDILGRHDMIVKSFEISDMRFDAGSIDIHAEKISEELCRTHLNELDKEIKKLELKDVSIHIDSCKADRRTAVTKSKII